MPTFVPHVSVDLNKLFQDRSATPSALGRESRGVVVMAENIPVVFVIRVVRSKQGRAYRAGEMFHMIFLV